MENFSIPPAVFVLPMLMLGVALHWYYMSWENKKGRGLLTSVAEELNLEFEATPTMLEPLLADFQMLRKADSHEFANCLSGELNGEQVHVFNFQGVEKQFTIYGHTVVVVESAKADLPAFQVEPRGYVDQKLNMLSNDRDEMLSTDEDFRCYRVTSAADESSIEQLFTTEVRAYLRDRKWHVESGAHHLLAYKHNKIVLNTQFQGFAEEVIELYHLLAGTSARRTKPRDEILVGDDGRLRLNRV